MEAKEPSPCFRAPVLPRPLLPLRLSAAYAEALGMLATHTEKIYIAVIPDHDDGLLAIANRALDDMAVDDLGFKFLVHIILLHDSYDLAGKARHLNL